MRPDPGSPSAVISDHVRLVVRALAAPGEADPVTDSVLNWVAASGDRISAAPVAFAVDRAVRQALATQAAGPIRASDPGGSDLITAMAGAPPAAQVVVALRRICGHEVATVARLTLRSVDDVERLLGLVPLVTPAVTTPPAATPPATTAPAPAHAPAPDPPPVAVAARPAPIAEAAPAPPPAAPPPAIAPPTPVERPEARIAAPPPLRRGPRTVRLSSVVILSILAGLVWIITRGGGERPSFADSATPSIAEAETIVSGRGCESASTLTIGGATARTVRFASVERPYRVFLPSRYQNGQRLPVVIDLGDFNQSADDRARGSGWETVAERENVIVVTAEPTGGVLQWNAAASPAEVDDVGYLESTLEAVADLACIDPGQIWVSGVGSGGLMSLVFACAKDAQIAGVVAAGGAFLPPGCALDQPVSMMAIHRADDDVFPLAGGVGPRLDQLVGDRSALTEASNVDPPPLDQVARSWASFDMCEAEPASEGADPAVTRWSGCAKGTVVELRVAQTGGHEWTAADAETAFAFLRSQKKQI